MAAGSSSVPGSSSKVPESFPSGEKEPRDQRKQRGGGSGGSRGELPREGRGDPDAAREGPEGSGRSGDTGEAPCLLADGASRAAMGARKVRLLLLDQGRQGAFTGDGARLLT